MTWERLLIVGYACVFVCVSVATVLRDSSQMLITVIAPQSALSLHQTFLLQVSHQSLALRPPTLYNTHLPAIISCVRLQLQCDRWKILNSDEFHTMPVCLCFSETWIEVELRHKLIVKYIFRWKGGEWPGVYLSTVSGTLLTYFYTFIFLPCV